MSILQLLIKTTLSSMWKNTLLGLNDISVPVHFELKYWFRDWNTAIKQLYQEWSIMEILLPLSVLYLYTIHHYWSYFTFLLIFYYIFFSSNLVKPLLFLPPLWVYMLHKVPLSYTRMCSFLFLTQRQSFLVQRWVLPASYQLTNEATFPEDLCGKRQARNGYDPWVL